MEEVATWFRHGEELREDARAFFPCSEMIRVALPRLLLSRDCRPPCGVPLFEDATELVREPDLREGVALRTGPIFVALSYVDDTQRNISWRFYILQICNIHPGARLHRNKLQRLSNEYLYIPTVEAI